MNEWPESMGLETLAYYLVAKGIIPPPHKRNKAVRWSKSMVDAWPNQRTPAGSIAERVRREREKVEGRRQQLRRAL